MNPKRAPRARDLMSKGFARGEGFSRGELFARGNVRGEGRGVC
jgi:hypothetical protein